MKFDRDLLTNELSGAVAAEVKKDKRPMTFTWGLFGGLNRLAGIVGAHVARSHDHLAARADSADSLFSAASVRIDRLEQKLSAVQKQLAALERKQS